MQRMTMERFWSLVDKSGDCWVWRGPRNADGYGYTASPVVRRRDYAHRISYELANGPVPLGRLVCHRCDNPPCVNPAHLYAGTKRDNALDAVRAGVLFSTNTAKTHCRLGHPFDYVAPKTGKRGCRTCRLTAVRAHRSHESEVLMRDAARAILAVVLDQWDNSGAQVPTAIPGATIS